MKQVLFCLGSSFDRQKLQVKLGERLGAAKSISEQKEREREPRRGEGPPALAKLQTRAAEISVLVTGGVLRRSCGSLSHRVLFQQASASRMPGEGSPALTPQNIKAPFIT